MPFAFVDMDYFNENIRQIAKRANGTTVRVASKSIRCVSLIKKVFSSSEQFRGIMCFTLPEALYLNQYGFDDLLVGYPTMQEQQITEACIEIRKGKTIVLMVDSVEHIQCINTIAEKHNIVMPVCLDVDMSSDFPALRFGVWRSSITSPEQALLVVSEIQKLSNIRLEGIMGYEAQIAGVGDNFTGQALKNRIVRWLKRKSVRELAERRSRIVKAIKALGIPLRFVNGGGTGSIESTITEEAVTEVTAGSGFFSSALFDNYAHFKHLPAAGFAIEITRKPTKSIITCNGGGYIASGSTGKEKQPLPYLPSGLHLITNEGAGEVQTPMLYNGILPLHIGDPVFMRHSKAGELCERFNTLLLVSDGKIVDEVKTYRGEGKCFL